MAQLCRMQKEIPMKCTKADIWWAVKTVLAVLAIAVLCSLLMQGVGRVLGVDPPGQSQELEHD